MSDILTLRVPGDEKVAWQKAAETVGEDLSEFARKAARQRVEGVRAKHGSPWEDLLGSVSTDAPPPTNQNVQSLSLPKGTGALESAPHRQPGKAAPRVGFFETFQVIRELLIYEYEISPHCAIGQ